MGQAAEQLKPFTPLEQLQVGRDTINQQADALRRLARKLPEQFLRAVDVLYECKHSVILMGIGKAGWIAQKISASFASTGTASHYVHPSEALHGDLGRITQGDVVVAFSNSGESPEILKLLPVLRQRHVPVIAVTGGANNSLARYADVVLDYGKFAESCPLGLAPTTSTTVMLALGDALTVVLAKRRHMTPLDFAMNHPGGALGKRLSKVEQVMRPLTQCRVSRDNISIRQTYVNLCGPQRRSGAILLVDSQGLLTGIFTDSDLARLLERQQDGLLDAAISQVMTRSPITITAGTGTMIAVETMACHNISELPVVDHHKRPLGLIDVTDVMALSR